MQPRSAEIAEREGPTHLQEVREGSGLGVGTRVQNQGCVTLGKSLHPFGLQWCPLANGAWFPTLQ